MDTEIHTLPRLFDQLGLDSWEEAIDHFIEDHAPLDPGSSLADAPFWSDSQRAFLSEALSDDSDWAEIVDQLAVLLR